MATSSQELKELKCMISSLLSYLSSQSQLQTESTPVTIAVDERQLLPTPISYLVKEIYLGPNHHHLVAEPGDYVTVHAWFAGNAIGYNPRNQMTGRIPKSYLEEKGSRVETQPNVVTISGRSEPYSMVGKVEWKAGDHLRICKWNYSHKNEGIAFNLRTFEMGKFHCYVGDIKHI